MIRVPSIDGVSVAVHELAGVEAVDHPILLVAHATGFHGRAYLPMAQRLDPKLHVLAMDSRGHGDTEMVPDTDVDWRRDGDDTVTVATDLAERPGGQDGLIGFGHSKGGATLLMAASREPSRFRLLVLFEPIVIPEDRLNARHSPSPLVAGARRRRATFPSIEEAIENYSSKPPLDAFDPAALDAYVRYGFKPDPEGVRLKCDPELEATTFERATPSTTWDLLSDVTTPVVVVSGRIEPMSPASMAEAVADELPNARYERHDSLDHFGPFTHPDAVAAIIGHATADLWTTNRN